MKSMVTLVLRLGCCPTRMRNSDQDRTMMMAARWRRASHSRLAVSRTKMALPTETRGREVNNNQDEAAYRLTRGPEVNYNQDCTDYKDMFIGS